MTHRSVLNLLGSSLLSLGDTETLEAVAKRAVDEGTRSLGAEHPLTVRARVLMAWAHNYRGRPKEMRQELDAVTAVMQRDPKTFSEDLATVWRMRADQAIDAARYPEAEAAAREAVSRAEATFGPRDQKTLLALGVLQTEVGLALLERRPDKSMGPLQDARSLFSELQQRVTPPHADALVGLGRANIDAGRPDRALPLLEEADRFWRDFDPDTRWAGEAALWLGRGQAALGRAAEAKATLSRAQSNPVPLARRI